VIAAITADNRFELCLSVAGRCRRLVSQRRAAATRIRESAQNQLAVEIRGREISLYLNEERVGTYLANQPVAGTVSLGVGPRTTAVFNRLRAQRAERVAASQ
jgi:hypothetical protein